MSYAQDNGYTPETFDEVINSIRLEVNDKFGMTFTEDSFVGTGWFKYAYGIAQKIVEGEVKTSEIFVKLQEYINTVNERINNPSVSYNGLIAAIMAAGFDVALKPILEADAGKVFVCVNLDEEDENYDAQKLLVAQLIAKYTVAGSISMGAVEQEIVLTNGQTFTFKFELPDITEIILRVTFVESDNVSLYVPTEEELRELIFASYQANYRVGLNFEPQRIFNQEKALWAETVLVEYSSDNGDNWATTVFVADYTDLLDLEMGDIEVVIA